MDTVIEHTMRTLKEFAIPFFKSTFGNRPHGSQILSIVRCALDYFRSNILKNYLEAIYASVQSQVTGDSQGGLKSQWEVRMQVEQMTRKILKEQPIVRFTECLVSDFPEGSLYQMVANQQIPQQQSSFFNEDVCIKSQKRQQQKQSSQNYSNQCINQQRPIFKPRDQLEVVQAMNNQFLRKNQKQLSMNEDGLILTYISNQPNQLIEQLLVDPEQFEKKKKKKKGKRSKGVFVKQTSKKKKLNLLKELHFQRIIRMKQKYVHIKVKLFPKQLQVLWLFKLTDQEIMEKTMNCNKQELKNLRKQFRQWREQLQKRSLKVDQTCHIHKNKIFYICLHQTIKKNVYLCNQCFQDTAILSKHYNHEIICKEHRKNIKYKQHPKLQRVENEISLQEQQLSKEQQRKYLCQQCPRSSSKRVSICHYQEIRLLCIQQQCVQMGVHMICPFCQSANHKNHSVVEYNKHRMADLFRMPQAIDVAQYEQLLIKAKSMLNFSLFQKIKRGFAEHALPILRFLEAFGIDSSEEVYKRINKFIAEQQREDLMVLISALRMKEMHSTQESRLNYLQVLNSMIEGEIEAMVESIQERLKQFCVRMKEAIDKSKGQVEAELNGKYQKIISIEVADQFEVSPMRLTDVHPFHYRRIQKITIKKEGEQQMDQSIQRERKNKKAVFFKQITNKLLQQNVAEQQHQKYIELIISNKDEKQIKKKYPILNQKQQKIIDSLYYQYYRATSLGDIRECFSLKQITVNKFNRLKAIHIQYLNYKPKQIEQYKYSFDGFALFQFISNNAQLQQVSIKGVQIQKMQQLIKSRSKNSLTYQPIENNTHLRLALEFQYELQGWYPDKFNLSSFFYRLQHLSYFRQQFQSLSQITVVIRFKGSDWGDSLERLLLCLGSIRKIKIKIHQMKYGLLKQLLSGLASLTEIASLSFDYGINQGQNKTVVSAEDYSSMEVSLTALFTKNTITHLRLHWCYDFPSLPKIATLQCIYFSNISFKGAFDLSQFIKANTKLKQISIRSMKQYNLTIEDQLFNRLQYLRRKYINSLSFAHFLPSSPSKLKYLSISDGYNNRSIDISILQPIFPKLANIVQLQLSNFDFGYQHLSAIPSKHLEKLQIWVNNKITDKCLQLIDSKWPYLKHIQLRRCRLITQRIFHLCRFKGLLQISVDRQKMSMLGRKHLMKRGIQLNQQL